MSEEAVAPEGSTAGLTFGTAEVKSKSTVVGVAKYPVYDNIDEALSHMGDAAIVGLVNAQVRTNALNAVRAGATGKPSKKALRTKAMTRITVEEFAECAGDETRIEALLVSKEKEILEAEGNVESGVETIEDEDNEDEDIED